MYPYKEKKRRKIRRCLGPLERGLIVKGTQTLSCCKRNLVEEAQTAWLCPFFSVPQAIQPQCLATGGDSIMELDVDVIYFAKTRPTLWLPVCQ